MATRAERALEKVRAVALALPAAAEKISHGAPVFHVPGGKLFVMFADDHHGDGRLAIWVRATHEIQAACVEQDPDRFFRPPYVGPSGWVGVRLDRPKTDWREVAALIEAGHRMAAPPKVLKTMLKSPR